MPDNKSTQGKEAYLIFHASINADSAAAFLNAITQFINEGFSKVFILFSTSGGQVNVGVGLYKALCALPIKIAFFNVDIVDSIGNVIFLAGDERYATMNSRFMFHSVGYETQAMRYELTNALALIENIKQDHTRISAILEEKTKLTSEEIEKFFYEAAFISPESAKQYGIVHDISDINIPHGARFIYIIMQ